MAAGQPVSLAEAEYPLFQAYDSVMVKADLEIGGMDQTLNLLAGRDLMKKMGMDPQKILTLPLLLGTDGKRKMSKSFGSTINLTDPPEEMFGKIMSLSDELMPQYFRLLTDLRPSVRNPRDEKLAFAKATAERELRKGKPSFFSIKFLSIKISHVRDFYGIFCMRSEKINLVAANSLRFSKMWDILNLARNYFEGN